MTSPLRRKRPTTVRGTTTTAPMPGRCALVLLTAAVVLGSTQTVAVAQQPGPVIGRTPVRVPVRTSAATPALLPSSVGAVPPNPLQQTRFQGPAPGVASEDEKRESQIQTAPPGLERLSRLDSDEKLKERIRQETMRTNPNEVLEFPEQPILTREAYVGRGERWTRRQMVVEPNFTCYGRLIFEDKNAERYGWEIGYLQPFLSAGLFWADVAMFPTKCASDLCGRECSTGHCLPGDAVPFMIYPLGVSELGLGAEIATVVALMLIFP